jgi:hypothetical protein
MKNSLITQQHTFHSVSKGTETSINGGEIIKSKKVELRRGGWASATGGITLP